MGKIVAIQEQLGVSPSGKWDGVTRGALVAYQAGGRGPWPMSPHGHPDAPTLMNLGYYDPLAEMPAAHRAYVLESGPKPGTFARDLAGAANQVPQWAWLVAGFGLLGLGIWAWKGKK